MDRNMVRNYVGGLGGLDGIRMYDLEMVVPNCFVSLMTNRNRRGGTYIDHSAPLTSTKVPRVTVPNHHTSPPSHPCLLASKAQIAGT